MPTTTSITIRLIVFLFDAPAHRLEEVAVLHRHLSRGRTH
jgi:hypothetical protein